ncbi:MAG: hypothetical protein QM769_05805 [Pseudoxanthomonas sp.]
MNAMIRIFGTALFLTLMAATVPASAAETAGIVFDCANPALPSQREVGELLGQSNFSQAYDSRTKLMAQLRRACKHEGARLVHLLPTPAAQSLRDSRVARK